MLTPRRSSFLRASRSMLLSAMTLTATLAMVSTDALAQDGPQGNDREVERNTGERGFRGGEGFRRGGGDRGRDGGRGRGGWGRGGMMGGGMGGFMQPYYLRRDMPVLVDELDLDDAQKMIIESLLDDYTAAFELVSQELQDQFRALRPDREVDDETRQRQTEIRDRMRDMGQQFRDIRRAAEESGETNEEAMEQVRADMDTLRNEMRELMPPRPEGEELQKIRESMMQLGRTWLSKREALNAEFVANLQAILADEQLELWPIVDRSLRRQKTLRQGRISGESVDLTMLLRELKLHTDELEFLSDTVDEYTRTLDRALVERNDHVETSRLLMFEAMFGDNPETALELMQQEADYRVAVREINERYVELMSAMVSEELDDQVANTLRASYRSEAFDRVYGRTGAQRSFNAALQIEGLDPDTSDAIKALQDAYEAELAPANASLVTLLRETEPTQNLERMRRRLERNADERREGGRRFERGPDPIRDAFGARNELDQRYRTQLEALLTPDQIETLPELRERRGGQGDRRNWRGNQGRDGGERQNNRRGGPPGGFRNNDA